jgi:N-formylmaleamate deformylase
MRILSVLTLVTCLAAPQSLLAQEPPAPPDPQPAAAMFAVEVSGTGPPMILIPGLISSGDVWKETVAHFASRYECHVLTLAGFAGQPPSGAKPFLSSVREAIAAYIRDRQLDEPVIVGHSLGGFLALSLASAHPDLVGKLVIVDGVPAPGAEQNPNATAEELEAMADRYAAVYAKTDAAARRQMIATMAGDPKRVDEIAAWDESSDRSTAVAAVGEIIASDVRKNLAKIRTPALVVVSHPGERRSVEDLERTFRSQFSQMKEWRLAIGSPGTRHFVMFDAPGWLFEQMDGFLGEQEPAVPDRG